VIRWNVREESLHDWAEAARDPLHQAGALRQAHYAQPQSHDADQTSVIVTLPAPPNGLRS
jgi:hypothetical protein